MGPDYATYDAEQLQQALRSIDAARFPERVEEIQARLAALAIAQHQKRAEPAAAAPERSSDLPILQRAGKVLVVIGVIDIAVMIYVVANGNSYSSSLNFFALIAGIFLWRGGLRAASVVRWLAWSTLPAMLMMAIATPGLQPWDLTLTELRLFPGTVLVAAALAIGQCGVMVWLVRELGRGELLAARVAAGRPLRDMRIPFALGVAGSLAGLCLMAYLLSGERADRAQMMVAAKLGAGYRYHVNSLNIMYGRGATAVNASVVAWNATSVLNVPVWWRE